MNSSSRIIYQQNRRLQDNWVACPPYEKIIDEVVKCAIGPYSRTLSRELISKGNYLGRQPKSTHLGAEWSRITLCDPLSLDRRLCQPIHM